MEKNHRSASAVREIPKKAFAAYRRRRTCGTTDSYQAGPETEAYQPPGITFDGSYERGSARIYNCNHHLHPALFHHQLVRVTNLPIPKKRWLIQWGQRRTRRAILGNGPVSAVLIVTKLVKLINLATTEIVSTAFAVAAIWIAIDRGMDVPLTEGALQFLTSAFTKKQTVAAKHDAPADLDYLEPGSSGWWKERTLDADSMPSYCKDSGSGSSEKAGELVEETYRVPGLLRRLRRRKPEGKATV